MTPLQTAFAALENKLAEMQGADDVPLRDNPALLAMLAAHEEAVQTECAELLIANAAEIPIGATAGKQRYARHLRNSAWIIAPESLRAAFPPPPHRNKDNGSTRSTRS